MSFYSLPLFVKCPLDSTDFTGHLHCSFTHLICVFLESWKLQQIAPF